MKKTKIIYFTSIGLLTAMMLMSAGMYIFNHEEVAELFTSFGYPTYIIYPLAIAKILGLAAIWSKKSSILKEWAYAGFFFDFVLAVSAHVSIQDGGFVPALVAIILVLTSYITDKIMAEAQKAE